MLSATLPRRRRPRPREVSRECRECAQVGRYSRLTAPSSPEYRVRPAQASPRPAPRGPHRLGLGQRPPDPLPPSLRDHHLSATFGVGLGSYGAGGRNIREGREGDVYPRVLCHSIIWKMRIHVTKRNVLRVLVCPVSMIEALVYDRSFSWHTMTLGLCADCW